MVTSHHFVCSQFLECLSVRYWITWINSLIFWSPLSYCPCVYLFALLSRRFIFQPVYWAFISSLTIFFLTAKIYVCVLCLFMPLFLVSWLYYVLLQLWEWGGRWWIVFVCFVLFPALPVLLSFFFLLLWFLSRWTLSLGIWRSLAIYFSLRVKHQKSDRESCD